MAVVAGIVNLGLDLWIAEAEIVFHIVAVVAVAAAAGDGTLLEYELVGMVLPHHSAAA